MVRKPIAKPNVYRVAVNRYDLLRAKEMECYHLNKRCHLRYALCGTPALARVSRKRALEWPYCAIKVGSRRFPIRRKFLALSLSLSKIHKYHSIIYLKINVFNF